MRAVTGSSRRVSIAKRALADGRRQLRRIEGHRVRRRNAQPPHPGAGQNDRGIVALAQFAQPRIDVAPNVVVDQIRAQCLQLRTAPRARGPDPRAGRQRFQVGIAFAAEGVARIFARRDRRDRQVRGQNAGRDPCTSARRSRRAGRAAHSRVL